MIFLDTNVWIDLLAVEAPDNEIKAIRIGRLVKS